MIMIFRQRVAWILLVVYLISTCAVFYYVFEMNEHYSVYALEHVETYHGRRSSDESPGADRPQDIHHNVDANRKYRQSQDGPGVINSRSSNTNFFTLLSSFLDTILSAVRHIADIPAPLLMVLALVVYLQIFCVLWTCTRSDPRLSACLWPVYVYRAFVQRSCDDTFSARSISDSAERRDMSLSSRSEFVVL